MSSVDVIPLGDSRRHVVPEGYTEHEGGWLVQPRRIDGLFPPCWCEPWLEPVFCADDRLGAIYVHRARDGREARERGVAA